eukprot:14089777-Ditylum_brightwellii.AAC.1
MATTVVLLQSIDLIHQQHFINDLNDRLMFRVDPGGFSRVEELIYISSLGKTINLFPNSDLTRKKLSHDIQYASHASGLPM